MSRNPDLPDDDRERLAAVPPGLNDEELREIVENLMAYLETLTRWDKEESKEGIKRH